MRISKSIVCTVFEGEYHYGVAALVNSLYACGFRGIIYAGYRGPLPPWAGELTDGEDGPSVYRVAPDLELHFARQSTEEMLANIKPDLIAQVWKRYGAEVENVFYIDCDIVIKAKWAHFEEWAEFGVALVEDMNSPLPVTHPLRGKWKKYYATHGIAYTPRDDLYVNGGFVGLNRAFRDFTELWKGLQDRMKEYTGLQDRIGIADRWNMFHYMDQDALNVAKDLTPEVSIMGRSAMDFGAHGYVMSHAAGRSKPWQKAFVRNILVNGDRPSYTDKLYWKHAQQPIRAFSTAQVRRKRVALKAASFVGRLFSRH